MTAKITCLSIDCPERNSICCNAGSVIESNMTPEHFVCSVCLKPFKGGKCDAKTGWDEEHWSYKCTDGEHESFWKTVVTSTQWKEWVKENSRRMHLKPIGECFDIDECRECGWISPAHFQAFLEFVKGL
jgi:hypothetical protein